MARCRGRGGHKRLLRPRQQPQVQKQAWLGELDTEREEPRARQEFAGTASTGCGRICLYFLLSPWEAITAVHLGHSRPSRDPISPAPAAP